MAVNSFKEDELSRDVKKSVTIKRMLSYLLPFKKEIAIVLLIMAYCVAVSIINPLFIEAAVDDYITKKDYEGLIKLVAVGLSINIVWIILVKIRMHIMAKVCNNAIKNIRADHGCLAYFSSSVTYRRLRIYNECMCDQYIFMSFDKTIPIFIKNHSVSILHGVDFVFILGIY